MMAAIPTIGESPHLEKLVDDLTDAGVNPIALMINRHDAVLSVKPTIKHFHTRLPGKSIYQEWNWAIDYAARRGQERLLILNDDIELMPKSIQRLERLWDSDPELTVIGFDLECSRKQQLRECKGSYRHNCISGFAFGVHVPTIPRVDEQFEWWGGDDDLFFQVDKQGGRLAIAEGAGIVHSFETTSRHYPWTQEAKIRDRQRFLDKWGEAW